MSMQDRPARTKPRPPADAGVDPIDFRPSTTTPAVAPSTTQREAPAATAPAADVAPRNTPSGLAPTKQATVQSGISWSTDIEALVARTKDRTGKSRRAIVEEAIAAMWGD